MATVNNSKFSSYTIATTLRNEELNLPMLFEHIDLLRSRIAISRVLLVDNGSDDETYNILLAFREKYNDITVLKNNSDSDYTRGVESIIQNTYGENVIFFHSDMQFNVSKFVSDNLMELQNSDLTKCFLIGRRVNRSRYERICTYFLSLIVRCKRKEINFDFNGQPKIFTNIVAPDALNRINGFGADLAIVNSLLQSNITPKVFDVEQCHRNYGKSSWNFGIYSKIKLGLSYIKNLINIQ